MKKRELILGSVVFLAIVALVVWGRDRIHFDFGVFVSQLKLADWRKIGIAAACIYTGYVFRSVRWALLLRHNKKVPLLSLLGTQVIGFTAVALIGRIADPVRPYLVARKTGLPLSNQIAVYIVERLFDAGSMALIFCSVILLAPSGALPHPEVIRKVCYGALATTIAGALFLVVVRLAGGAVALFLEDAFGVVSKGLGHAVGDKIRAFRAGLDTLRSFSDFGLAYGIAYVEAALAAGLVLDDFAPRLSFFFNAHNNLFEEVAKYRAARRLWASIMRDRFGATDPKSMTLRFHTQTGGSTLTAQQPENNIVRTTIQALAAALGGTQSLHTNGFDEALGLPTERAAKLALRTQQVLGYESGVADTVDPLAGSYFVEALTNEVERLAREYIETIDAHGGAVAAIESHFMQDEIESAAYEFARRVDRGEKVVVGVNRFEETDATRAEVFPIGEAQQEAQIARVKALKRTRDNDGVRAALEDLGSAARGTHNLLYPMKTALSRMATLGEIADVLRTEFGIYTPN